LWGYNAYGNIGNGTTGSISSPVQIGALTTWSTVGAAEYTTLALKTDGTLWSWGYSAQGQLGLGNTTYYSSPKQVGSLTTWLSASAGIYSSYGITTE
jgi:alpha-tubulin suppressor-like RCC1 family protein